MDTNNQSMIIDGSNPSMLWYNIADYIGKLSKSMVKTYNQRQRSNKPITWGELDKINQDLHNQLDIIISGDRNVKTISENRNMNKKQVVRLNEAEFNRLVKECVKHVLKEEFQYGTMGDYPYKDDPKLQPEGEPNGNNRRYVQVVMGISVALLVSSTLMANTLPSLCAIPKTGVFVFVLLPCVPSTFLLSCLLVSLPPT